MPWAPLHLTTRHRLVDFRHLDLPVRPNLAPDRLGVVEEHLQAREGLVPVVSELRPLTKIGARFDTTVEIIAPPLRNWPQS